MRSATRLFSSEALLAFFLSCICVHGAFAQSVATLTATVIDASKAYVPNAEVDAREPSTGVVHVLHTNKTGIATFVALQPGLYVIEVIHPGFEKSLSSVTLETGDTKSIEVRLLVGSESTTVTVNGSDNMALDTDAASKTTITQEEVDNLPLNGRTFQNLIAITPGVSRTGGAGLFSFNGQRDNTNYFTLDGVAANTGIAQAQGASLGQYGAGEAPSLSAAGTTSSLLSLDALDQITIQADNYSAEYGRSAGGQIQLTSRGGTNLFHGSAFDYIRNDYFDAWNSFSKFQDGVSNIALKKPALRMNTFGGTLGGPIRIPLLYNGRDRSFFFVSYEGLRLDSPSSGIFETLTAADRTQGNAVVNTFLNLAPPQGTNTLGKPLVDAYQVAAYAESYHNAQATNATSVRFDEKLNDATNLFFRVSYAPSFSSGRNSTDIGEVDTVQQYTYSFTAGLSEVLTPRLVNQLRGNYTRSGGHNISTLDNFGGATAPTSTQYSQMFPSQFGASPINSMFTFGDYASDGFAFQVGSAAENVQRQINLIDNVTWLKGKHQFKMGVDWRMLFPTAAPTVYSQIVGYYGTSSLASGSADIDIALSQDTITVHQHDVGLFLQDTWHLTQNLTLNAGLRWDVDPAPYGVNGKPLYTVNSATASNPSTITLNPTGSALYQTKYNQFQPRLGVAYVASHQSGMETLLKAGFGSFYVPAAGTAMTDTNFWPYNRYTVNFGQLWYSNPASPSTLNPTAPYAGQYLLAYSPNFVTPRTFEWNASIQQNLGSHRTVTLAYVGSNGRDLTRMSTTPGSQYHNAFGTLSEYYPIDTSNYNSLQASYVQHVSASISLLANYTWSHSFDTASNETVASDIFQTPSVQGERGPSDFDQRNAANIALDWIAPKVDGSFVKRSLLSGWAASTIFQAHSGNPLTATFVEYLASGNEVTLRPDLTAGVPLYLYGKKYFGGRALNPAAFNVNFLTKTSLTQGNEARGVVTDRGFDELDLSIRRDFKLAERAHLQYRCEVFNLMNQTSYAAPATQLGTYSVTSSAPFYRYPYFGTVQNTFNNTATSGTNPTVAVGGPRSIEMTLRLSF